MSRAQRVGCLDVGKKKKRWRNSRDPRKKEATSVSVRSAFTFAYVLPPDAAPENQEVMKKLKAGRRHASTIIEHKAVARAKLFRRGCSWAKPLKAVYEHP